MQGVRTSVREKKREAATSVEATKLSSMLAVRSTSTDPVMGLERTLLWSASSHSESGYYCTKRAGRSVGSRRHQHDVSRPGASQDLRILEAGPMRARGTTRWSEQVNQSLLARGARH